MIIVTIIILIFGMSSIAFVATNLTGGHQQRQFQQLANSVVAGELDPIYESTYVQNGFTWLKFYYTSSGPMFLSFVDSLPSTYTTNSGQIQLIVQKLNYGYAGNQQYVIISSPQGVREIDAPDETKIVNALCELLTVTPAECIFAFNITGSNV